MQYESNMHGPKSLAFTNLKRHDMQDSQSDLKKINTQDLACMTLRSKYAKSLERSGEDPRSRPDEHDPKGPQALRYDLATATTATFAVTKLLTSTTPKLKQSFSLISPHKTTTSLFNSSSSLRRGPQSLKFSTTATKISATISVGDKLPDATLSYFDSSDELQTLTISDLTANKKAILFAVPGAFTPTCSQKHLPGFAERAAEFKSKGIDTIACISVNDAFVMKAWKENLKLSDDILLLSDGNGEFTKAIGCELDLSDKPIGLGVRSRRYAMYVENGAVKILNLEEGGAFNVSSAEDMLKAI
ncbi:hypothetical protein BUALT_Bualt11G0102100 [Buddleja alternifolia]|uniref:Glutaredoxin-dependent peroxiredoxin n=1 Tax=Buddleja alternifolia TaxID=168488 RepID=A0AAV6X174_9LAMI|nr:hypothetical protein BUALT_Bualt11G0102100 [Buddleja alternifolia]